MISPQAIIDPSAQIAEGVSVGPGAIIGPHVTIGEGTQIGPYAMIQGRTTIGKHNKIFQYASIGDEPQDINYQGEDTRLEIGDHNVIREYCSISRGTVKGGEVTRIGSHNFLMGYSHVGHDCHVGNHVVMVNHSALSGHVEVQDAAVIGGYAAVHQFIRIGASAFVGRATYINKDVLPYLMIVGYDAVTCGVNVVGLKRRGFTSECIDHLRRAYKVIFRKNLTVQQALEALAPMEEACKEITPMVEMLKTSKRGIVR